MALASVVLPVYNGAKYIKEAVESVLRQTFTDFILFVIDDGSTDETVAILQTFSDKRLKIIRNEENKKLIYTLNRGLQLSFEGEFTYIIRMDADDICHKDRFEKQIAFMEANPHIGLCGSAIEEFSEKGVKKISHRPTDHEQIISELFFQNTIWHPTVILRSRVLQVNNFSFESEFLHAEDYALWCKIADVTKLANLPEVLLKYRVHTNNISVLYNVQQRETCNRISLMNVAKFLTIQPDYINKDEKLKIKSNYINLLNKIPTDAKLITKPDIVVLQSLLDINNHKKIYDTVYFEKSMSDFFLHYISLWCKKYSVSLFKIFFLEGECVSKNWTLLSKLTIITKCLIGWRTTIAESSN